MERAFKKVVFAALQCNHRVRLTVGFKTSQQLHGGVRFDGSSVRNVAFVALQCDHRVRLALGFEVSPKLCVGVHFDGASERKAD